MSETQQGVLIALADAVVDTLAAQPAGPGCIGNRRRLACFALLAGGSPRSVFGLQVVLGIGS